jgi:outer membrane protein assembly factor BamB
VNYKCDFTRRRREKANSIRPRHFLILSSISLAICLSQGAAAKTIGWRAGGDGDFAGATPPTEWGDDHNLLWRTPLSGWSNASPVVASGYVFAAIEPTTLVALRARDGQIAWQRSHAVVDALPAAEAAALRARLAAADVLQTKLNASREELGRLKRAARRGGAGPEVTAAAGKLNEEVQRWRSELDAVAVYRTPADREIVGYSSSTPVTDGRLVWCLFGNGVVAAHGLGGEVKWQKWLGPPPSGMLGFHTGHAASPVLADGVLVVPYGKLRGLDPETGEERWVAGDYRSFGTPVVMRLGADSLLVTPQGEIIRARDGHTLSKRLATIWYVAPVASGNQLFFVGNDGPPSAGIRIQSYRVKAQPGGELRIEAGWEERMRGTDELFAQPLLHDGLIYTISKSAVLRVIDTGVGRITHAQQLNLGESAVFPSPSFVGGHLHITGTDGLTLLFEPGRTPKPVATNRLSATFRASPYFEGKRTYMRALSGVLCIGAP